jgi:hypothetical protein
MGPTDLTARSLLAATGLVIALTVLGALLSAIAPALAGHTRPHPTLTGSLGDAIGILQNNVRVLAAPFLLRLLKFPSSRLGRRAGDFLILMLAAGSAIPVGLELGRWRTELLPYVPQLPLEWAALAVAISAWLTARHDHACPHRLAVLATATALLLAGAASIEAWCTPHRQTSSAASQAQVDTMREPHTHVGASGCLRHGFCAGDGRIASRSPAPFPSLRSVPLGRLTGADRATSTHRPPQGGITR